MYDKNLAFPLKTYSISWQRLRLRSVLSLLKEPLCRCRGRCIHSRDTPTVPRARGTATTGAAEASGPGAHWSLIIAVFYYPNSKVAIFLAWTRAHCCFATLMQTAWMWQHCKLQVRTLAKPIKPSSFPRYIKSSYLGGEQRIYHTVRRISSTTVKG